MFYFLLIIYFLLFTFLSWRNFHLALALFFFLLPTYLIRFSLGPLPTTLLEVMLWIVIIIYLIKHHKYAICNLQSAILNHKFLFITITLFLTATTISIFISSDLRAAAGEWKTFYIEPIILFLILVTSYKLQVTKNFINNLLLALILSGLITSLLATYQHFTGWLVPYSFWENQNTFRVTAWYGFPNAVGLFLAPLIPLSLYLVTQYKSQVTSHQSQKNITYHLSLITSLIFVPLAILAILFSRGTGPLIGLAAGLGFLLLLNKKTRWLVCIVGLVSIVSLVSIPQLSDIKQELLFQNRSGQIRLSIWNETWQFLKDNPLTGAGLASYQEKIKPYHQTVNGEGIEIFHHPHNIFLTMWVNLGLLGLVVFIWILIWFFKNAICYLLSAICYQQTIKPFTNLTIYLLSSMLTILVMGLADSPYIKNDLAILFWLLPALLIISRTKNPA